LEDQIATDEPKSEPFVRAMPTCCVLCGRLSPWPLVYLPVPIVALYTEKIRAEDDPYLWRLGGGNCLPCANKVMEVYGQKMAAEATIRRMKLRAEDDR